MKGAAAMAGAVTLSGVARMLEFAAKGNNGKRVRDVTPHFIEEWCEMKSRLLPLFADGEPAEKRALESSTMRTLLSILKNAVEEMDVDQADEIIQQLKETLTFEKRQAEEESQYTKIFEELFGDNDTLVEQIPDYDATDMLTAFEMKKI